MRISTSMISQNSLNLMMQSQTNLAKTQNEMSTGVRVSKPSDDPVAAVKLLQLQQAKSANTQYGTNITAATTRLNQEEQGLSDAQAIMQRVHELTITANSSTNSAADLKSIATELTQLNQQLADVANRKDVNGEYLFAGLSTATQPFVRNGSNAMTYAGDSATRTLQVGASQFVRDGDSGSTIFMNIPQGNGTFVLDAGNGNTGTGVISGSMQNSTQWVPGNYTLSFTSPTDWQITDGTVDVNGNPTVVTSGSNYVSGTAITFNGAQIAVDGTPAAGDSFSVNQSSSENVFTTIDSLISSLNAAQDSPAAQAQFQNQVSKALQQFDQVETNFSNVRTSVGTRSAMLDAVESTREDSAVQITDSIKDVAGADITEATVNLAQQTVALQAAQQAYVKIAQLSLFNYL
jgi:flagellar hook-associated protein 3 FlgL